MKTTIDSPVGPLDVELRDDVLVRLQFAEEGAPVSSEKPDHPALDALDAYFAGNLDALSSIRIELHGTPFQMKCWDGLRAIPVGEVVTYAELAVSIGHPKAFRAVGQANHVNPVAIVVPCHRVVAAGGGLGGYGGGLERKQWLLAHEGARASTLDLVTAASRQTA